jgi:metal-responsive CopG/Arc/MetJ family transcriptional regulator
MINNMKTIAITIEEGVLERIDRLTRRQGSTDTNRSRLIRRAVREYVSRVEREEAQEREAAIVRRHRARLARQAAALVRQQAKP